MSSAKFQKSVFQLHAITFQDRDLKNSTVKATKLAKHDIDATLEATHNNFMHKVTLNLETYCNQHQHFCLFSYWQHTVSDEMVLIKVKEVEHGCHGDRYYYRLPDHFTGWHCKSDSLKHCDKLLIFPDV